MVIIFKVTLAKAGLDNEKLISAWERLKLYVKTHFEAKLIKDETTGRKIWNHILLYCKKDCPNVCLLLQIGFSIASSNAAKERAFNISSLLLSDRRTKKMNHKTKTILMIICINNSLWNEEERSELISEAVDIHMEKKRRKTLDQEKAPEPKKKKMPVEVKIVESDTDLDSGSGEESEIDNENESNDDSES